VLSGGKSRAEITVGCETRGEREREREREREEKEKEEVGLQKR